jgi:D-alanyl-lipoteichoic acid acyltransferase DltB (MBOAT superfamily)
MNFAELRFWEFLFGALTVILVVRYLCAHLARSALATFDKIALFSLGLFLLLCVSWVTFLIFLAVAITTYVGLAWILKYHAKHGSKYLFVLIPLQILPLVYYKYGDFFVNRVMGFNVDAFRNLVIPVGISFYTFQKVAFVIDTLALKSPLPRFLDYLNFAGFFPQIVAGPIERKANLLPQMEKFRFRWLPEKINEGAGWIVVGLFFKCCLADNLAGYFNGSSRTNPYLIWKANLIFGLRIYYDFAGYSLVAVGLACCLGISLTLNFRSPYCSTSLAEFWRRWHITLSGWFRDYVYIPMGGGRVKWWAFNIAVVFIVSGAWHGAGWNFILWGALHGLFLIANRLGGKLNVPRLLAWGLTMVGSFYAWLSFYELRTDVLLQKSKVLLMPSAYNGEALHEAIRGLASGDGIALGGFLLLTALTLLVEWLSVTDKNEEYYYFRQPLALGVLVALTLLLAPGKTNAFIYFAF